MNPTAERRYGQIEVGNDLMRRGNVEEFAALFTQVIPLQTDYGFSNDSTLFTCASMHFEVVPPGNIPPLYRACISTKPDSFQLVVWFEKVNT